MSDAYFLIEGGKMLEVVKIFANEYVNALERSDVLAKEFNVKHVMRNRFNGTLTALHFSSDQVRHPDFNNPDRHGYSRPRKGSPSWKKFKAQIGYPDMSELIQKELNVPEAIHTTGPMGEGWRVLRGASYFACQFLWISSENGPYALVIPDVQNEVAYELSQGNEVDAMAKNFKMEFPGCKRILKEEWSLLEAQEKCLKALTSKESVWY